MFFRNTLSRSLLMFLRFTVGLFAGLMAIGLTASFLETLSELSTHNWHHGFLFLFLLMMMGGLAGALTYGLFFMRYWVISLIRVILGGLLLGFFVSLTINPPTGWQEVVASESWLVVNGFLVILGSLDVLLRNNSRYLTRGLV